MSTGLYLACIVHTVDDREWIHVCCVASMGTSSKHIDIHCQPLIGMQTVGLVPHPKSINMQLTTSSLTTSPRARLRLCSFHESFRKRHIPLHFTPCLLCCASYLPGLIQSCQCKQFQGLMRRGKRTSASLNSSFYSVSFFSSSHSPHSRRLKIWPLNSGLKHE